MMTPVLEQPNPLIIQFANLIIHQTEHVIRGLINELTQPTFYPAPKFGTVAYLTCDNPDHPWHFDIRSGSWAIVGRIVDESLEVDFPTSFEMSINLQLEGNQLPARVILTDNPPVHAVQAGTRPVGDMFREVGGLSIPQLDPYFFTLDLALDDPSLSSAPPTPAVPEPEVKTGMYL